ncbi:MAG: YIP1 family protein [Methanoregulaceae archaeon]|nr:YIP1 family protein [Methanoregulaceae archaeon]
MKGFLLSPVETFRSVKETDLGDSLVYYLILLVINAILSAIVGIAMVSAVWATFSGLSESLGLPLPAVAGFGVVVFAIVMIIVQFIFAFIIAAWLHLFVYLLGGRKGYLQTLKSVTFGSTPAMLLGWIPFIGFLAGIWTIVLEIFGIRELQEMATGKAVLAVLIAFLVIVVIIIAIAALFFIAFSEVVMQMSPRQITGI